MVKSMAGPVAAAILIAFTGMAHSQGTIQETRDTADMMIASAYACSQFLNKPQVLEEWRLRARDGLVEAGMTDAEADTVVDEFVAANKARTFDTMQQQVGCEMINIPALGIQ
jgi:hypothetical protein